MPARSIVKKLIGEYGSHGPASGHIRTELIIDPAQDHYEVVHAGWDGIRRVHGTIMHIDIVDGKLWIQYNGTRHSIGEELGDAGVPRDAVVPGFHPRDVRRYTDFAVGDEASPAAPIAQEAVR